MDSYSSEKLDAYLGNLSLRGASSSGTIQSPRKRAKLMDSLDNIKESSSYVTNSMFLNGLGVNQAWPPPSVPPKPSGQLLDPAYETSEECRVPQDPLVESEVTEEAQAEEAPETLPIHEGDLVPRDSTINVAREEVIKRVIESDDKFQALSDKYKNLSQNHSIDIRPIDLSEVKDPELRKLLEHFKFINISGISNLGEWKQVVYKQSCQISLNTKNASEFVNAFYEIADFIHHGEFYFYIFCRGPL